MRTWQMRLDPDDAQDQLIAQWLRERENMTLAVKGLILADVERGRGRGILHRVLAEVQEIKRLLTQGKVHLVFPPEASSEEDAALGDGIDSLFAR